MKKKKKWRRTNSVLLFFRQNDLLYFYAAFYLLRIEFFCNCQHELFMKMWTKTVFAKKGDHFKGKRTLFHQCLNSMDVIFLFDFSRFIFCAGSFVTVGFPKSDISYRTIGHRSLTYINVTCWTGPFSSVLMQPQTERATEMCKCRL